MWKLYMCIYVYSNMCNSNMKPRFFGFRKLISEWSKRKRMNKRVNVIGKSFMMSIGSRCFIYLWDFSLILELWCSYFSNSARNAGQPTVVIFALCRMGEKSNYTFPHTSRLLKEYVRLKRLKRKLYHRHKKPGCK